jgi:hypothetical protein
LIESGISLSASRYFVQDPATFKLDEASVSCLIDLCQFEKRKDEKGKKTLIIQEPGDFGSLGKMIKIANTHESDTIRKRAEGLIGEVESGDIDEQTGELTMSVDRALSMLTAEINRGAWVKTVTQYLDRQEDELPITKYHGQGNHLLAKETLDKAVVHLRTIFGL